ncbi:MAG: hypothetical protein K2M02_03430 [Duncaniella sp.]|nr:hypothetical protein [Duncaniella sp.]MDE6495315.1 hypothetical protein [Duncaniella sp.]
MIGSIVTIILGIVIWKLVPGWIEGGNASIRSAIRLVCSIIGIIITLVGAYDLVMSLIH